jgi:hypothetical protein
MKFGRLQLISVCLLSAAVPAMAYAATHKVPASAKALNKHAAKPKAQPLGQRGIDDQRATQLQAALIQSGYLTGQPSGHWDSQTEAAMTKLQADNGWQTKLVPDSRAIIKLGLGPSTASNSPANTAAPLTAPTAPLAPSPHDIQ